MHGLAHASDQSSQSTWPLPWSSLSSDSNMDESGIPLSFPLRPNKNADMFLELPNCSIKAFTFVYKGKIKRSP